jgi:hypothetical protein
MNYYNTLRDEVQSNSTTPPGIALPAPSRSQWLSVVSHYASVAITSTALFAAPVAGTHVLAELIQAPMTQPAMPASAWTIPARRVAAPSTAALVQELHSKSGLTWDQLGRIFGVSRRAVHLWAAGGQINAKHLELLFNASATVSALKAESPAESKLMLFESKNNVTSIFDQLVKRSAKAGPAISGSPFRPDELMDAR